MKNDRRVIKTKHSIREALVTLIEKKGFDAITVTDLTETANINRGTFYLHYEDKFDLLRKIEEELILAIDHIIEDVSYYDFLDDIFENKPLRFLVDMFDFISDNKRLFKAILGPTGDRQFYNTLREFMISSIYSRNKEIIELLEKSNISLEYFTAYISSAHLGVIEHWLNNDLDLSPHDVAMLLTKMFKIGPSGVINYKNKAL